MMMPHQCQFCEMEFARESSLTAHMRVHTGNQFTCEFCEKAFVTRQQLSAHVRVHTGEKPFVCGVCEMAFAQKGNLTRHTLVHTGDKPHTCIICNKSFSEKHSLKRHLSVHTGHTRERCDVCGKSYSDKLNLARHQTRMHTMFSSDNNLVRAGVKPHTCEECGKSFSQHGSLLVHMFTHTGERPHPCEVCGKSFSQKGSLKRHMMVHTGAKPFACTVCGRCFSEKGSVKKHMTVHGIMYDMAQMEATGSYVRIDDGNVQKRIHLSGVGDSVARKKEIIKQRLDDLVNIPGLLAEENSYLQNDTTKEFTSDADEEALSDKYTDEESDAVGESMPDVSFTEENDGAMYITGAARIREETSDKSEDESFSSNDDVEEYLPDDVDNTVKNKSEERRNIDDEGQISDSSVDSDTEHDVDHKIHFLEKDSVNEHATVDMKVRGRYFNVGSGKDVLEDDEKPHTNVKCKKHFLEKDTVNEYTAVGINKRGQYFYVGNGGDTQNPSPSNGQSYTGIKGETHILEKDSVNEQIGIVNVNMAGTYFNVGSGGDMHQTDKTNGKLHTDMKYEEAFSHKEEIETRVDTHVTCFNVSNDRDVHYTSAQIPRPEIQRQQHTCVKYQEAFLHNDIKASTPGMHGMHLNVGSVGDMQNTEQIPDKHHAGAKYDDAFLKQDSLATPFDMHGRHVNVGSGRNMASTDQYIGLQFTETKCDHFVSEKGGFNHCMSVDNGGKQHICYICETAFADNNVLAKHMQVHVLEYTTHM